MLYFKFLIVSLMLVCVCCSNISDSYTFVDEAYHYVTSKYGSNNVLTASQLCNYFQSLGFSETSIKLLGNLVSDAGYKKYQSGTIINSTMFSLISSSILTNSEKKGYTFCYTEEEEKDETVFSKPNSSAIWGFGFLSVTIISICSLVGISILPLMKSKIYDKILLFLIALAVGTLSSNGIFQLIPEGFGIDGNPMTVWQSAVIFAGVYLFYLTENLLERIFNTAHSHADNSFDQVAISSTSTISGEKVLQNQLKANTKKLCNGSTVQSQEVLITLSADIKTPGSNCPYSTEASLHPVVVKQKQCWVFKNYKSIKTVAWLITVADGMHNFIDGLAIGASFSISMVQGVSTSLAIFCEEFPHELGDFAILITSGMTIKQAAFYNFASACCCYIGFVVGVLVGSDISSARWIFALAGGVFLYISLAGMLPEAQALCLKKNLKQSPWLCMFIKHTGLLCGFTIMFILTLYKDKIKLQ